MPHVYLHGRILPREEARISVDDRGFRYGDGVFETIHAQGGALYLWERHMRRMEYGARLLGLPCDAEAVKAVALSLLAANAVRDGVLRIVLTRGCGGVGYLPRTASHAAPTLFMETDALPPAPPEEGILVCVSRLRKAPLDALSGAKLISAAACVLARLEAEREGCGDALLLGGKGAGKVCESASANIFWYKNRTLFTPSLATGCLPGVTRDRLLEISGYPVRAGEYSLRRLLAADAVFLTNSAALVIPVRGLKGYATRWERGAELARMYRTRIAQDIAATRARG